MTACAVNEGTAEKVDASRSASSRRCQPQTRLQVQSNTEATAKLGRSATHLRTASSISIMSSLPAHKALSMILMAYFLPSERFCASFTTAKLPVPSSLPILYFFSTSVYGKIESKAKLSLRLLVTLIALPGRGRRPSSDTQPGLAGTIIRRKQQHSTRFASQTVCVLQPRGGFPPACFPGMSHSKCGLCPHGTLS